ncbi:DUF397 domain-containing protein [Nonomuraea endophytica]|uniref:DUF397 domain-containing protein n=1 Tax=Nonomuraea endophytica TaxID=714136 RepID=A0A7W8AH08_9ACTN|nr:DUF397 domain-containing protein [Nonomuraea endophytica]MBB5084980.1 hypothetical protein [Nonomuraea endophytica]
MSEIKLETPVEFRSACDGGTCVEVAMVQVVAVRDSKDPHGPVLLFDGKEWEEFTGAVKAGEFDVPGGWPANA